LYRRLGGPHSRSRCDGEEKNSHSLPRLEPPIIELVAQRYTDPGPYCTGLPVKKLKRKITEQWNEKRDEQMRSVKSKGKVVLCLTKHQAKKTYCGRSGGIAPPATLLIPPPDLRAGLDLVARR
jgi:hypothetical protein